MTSTPPRITDPLEDFYGPVDEPVELLTLHGHWKKFQEQPLAAVSITGKRGRPRKWLAATPVISELSPKELARGDLIDVARNWDAIVQRVRVEGLDSGRPIRVAKARDSIPSLLREQRVAKVVDALVGSRLSSLTVSNAAERLVKKPEFQGVSLAAMKKYIGDAKKRIRHT